MSKKFKQVRYIIDKDELEGLIKKNEACELCNKVTKVAEILGLTVGAAGLLAKSLTLGGIGLGITGLSLLARAISNKIQEKTEQQIEMLSNKPLHLINKQKQSTETDIEKVI